MEKWINAADNKVQLRGTKVSSIEIPFVQAAMSISVTDKPISQSPRFRQSARHTNPDEPSFCLQLAAWDKMSIYHSDDRGADHPTEGPITPITLLITSITHRHCQLCGGNVIS